MTALWIRADADPTIGLGHVMRMVALAEAAAERSIPVVFVAVRESLGATLARDAGFAVVGLPGGNDRSWLDHVAPADVVVYDGYRFSADDLRAAASAAAAVAVMDDGGDGEYPADVVVNQNPVAAPRLRRVPSGHVLIGPRYALVRRAFRLRRRRRSGSVRHLVLTFGGADTAGAAAAVVDALGDESPFETASLLVGPAAPSPPPDRPPWLRIVRGGDVASLFDTADAAISAAGATTWELLCMGVPTALVQTADNQRHVGPGVAAAGAGLFLGPIEDVGDAVAAAALQLADVAVQDALSVAALAFVDGHGPTRVLDVLLSRVAEDGPPVPPTP